MARKKLSLIKRASIELYQVSRILWKLGRAKYIKLVAPKERVRRYIRDYEFFDTGTPMFKYGSLKTHNGRYHENWREVFLPLYMSRCFGVCRGEETIEFDHRLEMEASPPYQVELRYEAHDIDDFADENTVDDRADEFISRFYQEMATQLLEWPELD